MPRIRKHQLIDVGLAAAVEHNHRRPPTADPDVEGGAIGPDPLRRNSAGKGGTSAAAGKGKADAPEASDRNGSILSSPRGQEPDSAVLGASSRSMVLIRRSHASVV
jgi:hypothetical protein